MSSRRGRPPLHTSTALRRAGTRIVVRVSRREYDILRSLADASGDTIAGCVREALYEYGVDVFAAPSSISGQPPT